MWRVATLKYEVYNFYSVQEPAMITAVDAAVAEQEEPIAGPSGLCGQRLDPAPSQDLVFADAMEEVCTIYIFVTDCIWNRNRSLWRCV